ncbi:MAG: F0F1 ATP synthase subunit delta [Parasphingopyxis sp.]|nr:F0F1 ATP synthase subunit delta [Sphingomonadales bacterium]
MDISGGIKASLAGRYAYALFELAQEQKQLESVEASLARLKAMLGESAELRQLTTSPLVDRDEAVRAISAVAQAMELDPLTAKFLGTLAQNRRLTQLGAAIRAFNTIAAQYRGETDAEVASAHPLTDDQLEALKSRLKGLAGRDVNIDMKLDSALLGGLVVRMGSRMIDGSLRTKLNSLSNAMKG